MIQVIPTGDAERDAVGHWWEQHLELMHNAIIYLKNNPSILFYGSGSESISCEHMLETIATRDMYDPCGGRAISSRKTLDIREAEQGGEILYISENEHCPMFATGYCRDEGLRKYQGEYGYPFHEEGAGPLYKKQNASAYSHSRDILAVELIRHWHDYWREWSGAGRKVSSGDAKVIFSDTQTRSRGGENYHRSGVMDPLKIPRGGFFAHRAIWDGWIDTERRHTYIIGYWNYTSKAIKPVYVVSSDDKMRSFVSSRSKGSGRQDYCFLFTFGSVQRKEGIIETVSYGENNKELSRCPMKTVGGPYHLELTFMHGSKGLFANGADLVILQVEVVDANGDRCPLADNMIKFDLQGPAGWHGSAVQTTDNYVLAKEFLVKYNIIRALTRSTEQTGDIMVRTTTAGLPSVELSLASNPVEVKDGLSTFSPGEKSISRFGRGETSLAPSHQDSRIDIRMKSAIAGINNEQAIYNYDSNESNEWKGDGKLSTAWTTYHSEREAEIDDICIKLTGWRKRFYPLEIFVNDKLVWSGNTERSLGYTHLSVKPVRADKIIIKLEREVKESNASGQIMEIVEPNTGDLDLLRVKSGKKTDNELKIVEVEFLEVLKK